METHLERLRVQHPLSHTSPHGTEISKRNVKEREREGEREREKERGDKMRGDEKKERENKERDDMKDDRGIKTGY